MSFNNCIQASADDKCQKFSKSLAKGCKANSDCNEISCTKTFAGEDLSISVVINKCDEPVTVTSNVKVPHLSIDWSHKYASDDIVEVPGFSVTLKGIISAGVFVQVQFDSEGDQMNMKVSSFSITITIAIDIAIAIIIIIFIIIIMTLT